MIDKIKLNPNETFSDPLVFGSVELMENETLDNALNRMRSETRPLVEEFCRRYNVKVDRLEWNGENGKLEPFYLFSNGFCYSPEGLRNSLSEQ